MISPLTPKQCNDIAILHLKHLRTHFWGGPGRNLLSCYYEEVCRGGGACGYVAQSRGKILGYVCGVWDGEKLKKGLITHAKFYLSFWLLMQVLAKPELIRIFYKSFFETSDRFVDNSGGYELRPIVVVPEARGSGVAKLLVDALVEDAAERGFSEMFLYTEEDNFPANAFYRKAGFNVVRQELRDRQAYLRYELRIK